MTNPGQDYEEKQKSISALSRRLRDNREAFVLNNIMRMREMLRLGTPGFKSVFQNVPYFLQVNRPKTPGYLPEADAVRGIYGFDRSGFARIFREMYPERSIRELLAASPRIQSLMLIGSTGSVGHTSQSDLDYWVCYDRHRIGQRELDLLRQKLDRVSYWADRKHRIEVHFFLTDLEDILDNRIGAMDEDSSGDVMPRMLKEEFYRTVLHVCGRLPLWWVTPLGADQALYEKIAASLDRVQSTALDTQDFVDLGFPQRPGPLELLGAAMWQAHKSRRDPFKAVLKLVLIMEEVYRGRESPLLCEQVKAAVFSARPDTLPVDPYLLTIRRALDFAAGQLPENLDLVRVSAWFKLFSPLEPDHQSDGHKADALADLTASWNWPAEKAADYRSYARWPLRRKLTLGGEIKALILDLYSQTAARLRREFPDQVLVRDDNLTRLNARLMASYTELGSKVEELPSEMDRRSMPRDINIVHEQGVWRIYDSLEAEGEYVYQAQALSRVTAWLVHNGLWRDNLVVRLRPGDKMVKRSAVLSLAALLRETLHPAGITTIGDDSLLARPAGPGVLIVNMEIHSALTRLMTAELIYQTTLGETIHEVVASLGSCPNGDEFEGLAQALAQKIEAAVDGVRVFVPPGQAQEFLVERITAALGGQAWSPDRTSNEKTSDGPSQPARTRLDTD